MRHLNKKNWHELWGKSMLLIHPLCLSPCPPFCSFCWKTCSERTVKLLLVQYYQSLLLRMMKRRSWPTPYCHTGHRKAAAKVLGKHPHPLGNWPGAGSTTQLDREEKRQGKRNRNSVNMTSLKSLFPVATLMWNNLQSSFMQNFCQLIVLWVAISAQAFRCSIYTKRSKL